MSDLVERLKDAHPNSAQRWAGSTILLEAAAEILRLREENARIRQIISDSAAALPNRAFISPSCSVEFMEGLPKEIALVCGQTAWKGMDTAPKDHEILLDISYWYPDDKSITACFAIGLWEEGVGLWDASGEWRRSDQINAWMDVPPSSLARPEPDRALLPAEEEKR